MTAPNQPNIDQSHENIQQNSVENIIHPEMSETAKRNLIKKAICVLDHFQKKRGLSDKEASITLGFSKSNIAQLRKAFATNRMGHKAAEKLMSRIEEYLLNEINNYQHSESNPLKEPEEPTSTSDYIRDILSAHFETQTDYSIREIQESANEIDLILSAKRVGAIVRITADLSVGSLK